MNAKLRIFMQLQTSLKTLSAHFRPTPKPHFSSLAQTPFPIRKNGLFTDGRDRKAGVVRENGLFTDGRDGKAGDVRENGDFTDGWDWKAGVVRENGDFTDGRD